WGTIVIATNGSLRMTGVTADGKAFTTAAPSSEQHSWPVFIQTSFHDQIDNRTRRTKRGSISGMLTAADLATSDISGPLRWIRPYTARGAFHDAVDVNLTLEASRYLPIVPALSSAGVGTFSAWGTGATAFSQNVSFDDNTSRVTPLEPNDAH